MTLSRSLTSFFDTSDGCLIGVYGDGVQFSEAVKGESPIRRERLQFCCDRGLAEQVGVLAQKNNIDEGEALRQLVEIGLDEVSSDASG